MDVWNANALIGTRLGSSTLERPLGIGGMGAVYLARQERPRRHVAVKVLRPGIAADDSAWQVFLARFRREADAAAALDHANIVPIYEFGEQGSMAYIVMPYLSDGSLANFLLPNARLSVDQVVAYLDQAASALDYAHQHAIVHRDVKPSNLLLHPDGRVLLADFGIARPLNAADLPAVASVFEGGDLTVTGAAMGTPEYMAPEQVRGETVSAATDTYALGVVAYTLLAGRTPFEGHDVNQILARQLTELPPPLRSMRRDVPRDVEEAISWAMAKDPSHRPGSTGAFARALHAASTGVPTTGRIASVRSRPQTILAATGARNFSNAAPPVLSGSGTDTGLSAPPDGPDSPTLYDGAYRGGFAGRGGFGAPAWPSAPSSGEPPPPAMQPRTLGILALLGAAGVFLVIMAVVLASGSLQNFANFNQNNSGDLIGRATETVAPTVTPMPSPTPVANWLSLSRSDVAFGCKVPKRTATVTLTNLGPDPTDWTSKKAWTAVQISISPQDGSLDPGQSTSITLNYNPGPFSLQNSITFTANNDAAGAPAVLNYTAPSCFGGNALSQPLDFHSSMKQSGDKHKGRP